jgi:site-specific recombinase XerD
MAKAAAMELEVVEQHSGPIALSEALAAARTYAERSLAVSTRRGYARDLAAFRVWCQARAVTALPAAPQTLAAYLADLALTDRPATIGRKVAAIAVAHRDAGLESPTEHGMVKRTLAGIRREKGTAQNQKNALLVDDLRRMVAPLSASLLDRRDRALMLLGFAAALRRSELVALRFEGVRFEEEGLVLTLRRSKTNQEGRRETVAVAYGSEPTTCPVRAVRAWLAAAGLVAGPLFVGLTPQGGLRTAPLGDRMVAHVLKRRCKAAGIDPAQVAGHSLRRGFATAAARAKKPDRMIKRHGRWKSTAMLERYIEDGARWDDNASAGLGL